MISMLGWWTPLICEGCGTCETEEIAFPDAVPLCKRCRPTRRSCSKCGDPECSEVPFPEDGGRCKMCIADYNYRYDIENKERIAIRKMLYIQSHEEIKKEYTREHARKNAEKYRENRRAYYKNMTAEQKEAHRIASKESTRRTRAKKKAERENNNETSAL
jgi:hypothetical protein